MAANLPGTSGGSLAQTVASLQSLLAAEQQKNATLQATLQKDTTDLKAYMDLTEKELKDANAKAAELQGKLDKKLKLLKEENHDLKLEKAIYRSELQNISPEAEKAATKKAAEAVAQARGISTPGVRTPAFTMGRG